ncbi:HNH endonuclease signature motif containing protein [Pseudorhodobacter sp. MZDSW-24AT]|uniref:HNH endonuclease signature motif containing protein n=1 Tax=Pseudorhodobacter sp. MZDSW-24AT TaxID=2052957 RepID=UPI000C1F283E|nr:HNH endonuclease signature motif containing protein [Pseudorhodobacter sp. MZDSW-24AT]PJF10786.1 HNH endonuclease [Pseudorhodobacter sp. MZDSW-24AT]
MPAPPRACACGRLVASGTRCACQIASTRARNARHDSGRPTAAQRGYNHEWRKARAAFLALHPCCVSCFAPATVVDHIIPHRGDDALFWNRQNWQALCANCHNGQKQRKERASA